MASKSWFKIEAKAGEDSTTISIHDEIGAWGVTSKEFISALSGVKTGKIKLKIDSPGGDVFQGIAIHNALKQHSAKVDGHVDGLAASIASIILMACDTINMPTNTFLMIHRASSIVWGNEEEMLKMADTLKKIDATLCNVYMEKSGAKKADVIKMMNDETWLNADEALAAGFCDTVGEPSAINAKFNLSKFSHVPQAVAAMNMITKPENERDLEAVLRDSGLSKKDALTAVASLKAEALRDSGAEEIEKLRNYRELEACKSLLQ